MRSLFTAAVDQLRLLCAATGKEVIFSLFERYDLDDAEPGRPTYADLAREFRRISLDLLRETTASDAEFRREARSLLGHAPE